MTDIHLLEYISQSTVCQVFICIEAGRHFQQMYQLKKEDTSVAGFRVHLLLGSYVFEWTVGFETSDRNSTRFCHGQ